MRTCKCGCGKSIEHKHTNAKFLSLKHKDRFHNTHNPRGYGVRVERDIEEETHPQDPDALGQWD